jgi:hypothetical protein
MRLLTMVATVALMLVAVSPEAIGGGGTPITTCGQFVPTNALLTQDLYCPGQVGIVVGAEKITIDLRGFTLRGDGTQGKYGIADNGYALLTIKNGVVRNFDYGVVVDADRASVSNLVVSGSANDGIHIAGDSAKIGSSTASGNHNWGINVTGDSAKIQSTTASGNASYGIHITGDSGSVQSSTADGNGIAGIEVDGISASVKSSAASANAVAGLVVNGTAGSIRSSAASANGSYGIYSNGNAPVLKGNRAEANGFPGGVSDLTGLGVYATGYTTPPAGTNVARGNDDPAECIPASLC